MLERILRQNLEQDYRRIFEASFTWKQFLYEMFVLGKSIIINHKKLIVASSVKAPEMF